MVMCRLLTLCSCAFAVVLLVFAMRSVEAQDAPSQRSSVGERTVVGDVPVGAILERLGAELEDGVSSDQLANYARQFGRVDSDGDGRHSKAEYVDKGNYLTPRARQAIFNAADSDRDGFVTKEEYTLNRIITDEAKAILQAMDDDGDGIVQQAEFAEHGNAKLSDEELTGHVFDALDTNGNGEIVVPEYLRVWGRWARIGRRAAAERLAAKDTTEGDASRLAELDTYWAEVSRSVREGDFEGYQATCHPEGVLVSGFSKTSYPLTEALARWKQGFADTQAGKMKASVEFRFSQRLGDATTAHETGIFLYSSADSDGDSAASYVHFEALLVKDMGAWKILMEYQKSKGSRDEWDALE